MCNDPPTIQKIFSRIRNFSGEGSYPKTCGGVQIVHVRDVTTGYDSSRADLRSVSWFGFSGSEPRARSMFRIDAVANLKTPQKCCFPLIRLSVSSEGPSCDEEQSHDHLQPTERRGGHAENQRD